jgi:hypothetical protein
MARERRRRRSGWFWVFVIVVLVVLLGLFFGGYRKGTKVGMVSPDSASISVVVNGSGH